MPLQLLHIHNHTVDKSVSIVRMRCSTARTFTMFHGLYTRAALIMITVQNTSSIFRVQCTLCSHTQVTVHNTSSIF